MKIIEAIEQTDASAPNTLTVGAKLKRLSDIDREIREEVICRHLPCPSEPFTGYDAESDMQTELLVPPPYDELYRFALAALVHYEYGEISRYNNDLACYESLRRAYSRRYNRDHLPTRGELRFY